LTKGDNDTFSLDIGERGRKKGEASISCGKKKLEEAASWGRKKKGTKSSAAQLPEIF